MALPLVVCCAAFAPRVPPAIHRGAGITRAPIFGAALPAPVTCRIPSPPSCSLAFFDTDDSGGVKTGWQVILEALARLATFPVLLVVGALSGAALGAALMMTPSLSAAAVRRGSSGAAAAAAALAHALGEARGFIVTDARVLLSMLAPLPAALAALGLSAAAGTADALMYAGSMVAAGAVAAWGACVGAVGMIDGAAQATAASVSGGAATQLPQVRDASRGLAQAAAERLLAACAVVGGLASSAVHMVRSVPATQIIASGRDGAAAAAAAVYAAAVAAVAFLIAYAAAATRAVGAAGASVWSKLPSPSWPEVRSVRLEWSEVVAEPVKQSAKQVARPVSEVARRPLTDGASAGLATSLASLAAKPLAAAKAAAAAAKATAVQAAAAGGLGVSGAQAAVAQSAAAVGVWLSAWLGAWLTYMGAARRTLVGLLPSATPSTIPGPPPLGDLAVDAALTTVAGRIGRLALVVCGAGLAVGVVFTLIRWLYEVLVIGSVYVSRPIGRLMQWARWEEERTTRFRREKLPPELLQALQSRTRPQPRGLWADAAPPRRPVRAPPARAPPPGWQPQTVAAPAAAYAPSAPPPWQQPAPPPATYDPRFAPPPGVVSAATPASSPEVASWIAQWQLAKERSGRRSR